MATHVTDSRERGGFNWHDGHGAVHTRAQRVRGPRAPKKKSSLSPALRQALDPTAPLSGKGLLGAANALTDLAVKPQIAALDRQRAQTVAAGQSVTGSANSYLQQLAARQAALAAQAKDAVGRSNGVQDAIAKGSQDAQAAMAAAGQGRVDEDAAVRGDIATTANDDLAKAFAQRASSAEAHRQADQTAENLKGAAGEGAAIGAAQASNLRGGEMMQSLADRYAQQVGDIQANKRQITDGRGDALLKNLLDLRQQGFDNGVTLEGLGIKRQDLQNSLAATTARVDETNRHNKAMESTAQRAARLADSRFQLDRDKYGASTAKDRYQKRHGLGPYKAGGAGGAGKNGLTPTQRDARRQKSNDFWQSRVPDANTVLDQAKGALPGVNVERKKSGQPPLGWNDATARQVLMQKGYHSWEVDAIFDLRHGGVLSPKTLKVLKSRHIHIPGKNRPAKGPAGKAGGIAGLIAGALGIG